MMADTGKQSAARAEQAGRIEAGLDRLEASLDAAQDAAKALRRDVGRGTRDMAKNVETMLTATRKDTRKLARAVRRDVGDLQRAVTSPPAPRPTPARRRAAQPATGRRTGAAAARRPGAT
jgi:hypothetical protein